MYAHIHTYFLSLVSMHTQTHTNMHTYEHACTQTHTHTNCIASALLFRRSYAAQSALKVEL
jgi:hypothetical protein